MAVPVARNHPFVDQNSYPREALLEAIVRYLEERLPEPVNGEQTPAESWGSRISGLLEMPADPCDGKASVYLPTALGVSLLPVISLSGGRNWQITSALTRLCRPLCCPPREPVEPRYRRHR